MNTTCPACPHGWGLLQKFITVQAVVVKGASKEKIGLRGSMPPGILLKVCELSAGAEYIAQERRIPIGEE